MEIFLGKITHHAMNYAIRSGIAITSTYAIKQCSRLLKTVENSKEYDELHILQERLYSKIQIISPAIDMIELISARGNTSLESAVTLTKALRKEIQALGVRIETAASAEETSRRNNTKASTKVEHEAELRFIIHDIKRLMLRIEDAVPLINLAITTSGARLSTTLPATVSPSRLLQASTLLTAGDTVYSMNPSEPAYVGPPFKLSLYMLFAGHKRKAGQESHMRNTTWKEVMHKAEVRLIRVPLREAYGLTGGAMVSSQASPIVKSIEGRAPQMMAGEGAAAEYAYQLELIEDLDDDRVHEFEPNEPQPGPYKGVKRAGIREHIPIYEVSKIFYADTGKILNIGSDNETNNPILLLKRDPNAEPPRRMMDLNDYGNDWYEDEQQEPSEQPAEPELVVPESARDSDPDSDDDDGNLEAQFALDNQLHQESSVNIKEEQETQNPADLHGAWRLPVGLDPEWMAFEVYTEEDDSDDEDQDATRDSGYVSGPPTSNFPQESQAELAADLNNLRLNSPASSDRSSRTQRLLTDGATQPVYDRARASPLGPITTSLSLLEMLIRLTALQQFEQSSHLSIRDELLSFFLEDSSTTGAGGNGDQRRRTRAEARNKVGFDPYDESPIKRHGEDYQRGGADDEQFNRSYSRGGTPYDDYDSRDDYSRHRYSEEPFYDSHRDPYSPRTPNYVRSATPQQTLEPWARGSNSPRPTSPASPYRPRRQARPLDRVHADRGHSKPKSPLARGKSAEARSTSGTSPASPSLGGREE